MGNDPANLLFIMACLFMGTPMLGALIFTAVNYKKKEESL